ncbi:hypothetical protein JXA32_10205 [Candidatus Sumerlaeota bacterium]|nr:hypothetical protein [Candidatus Sumerlaeota bacterium]
MAMQSRQTSRGLSVIEMLIIISMVMILTTIACQQNQSRGVRSWVSRVKADQRSLATAIEAYFVDHNAYPAMASGANGENELFKSGTGAYQMCTFRSSNGSGLCTLTTPISYIPAYPPDPFADSKGPTFGYRQFEYTWVLISYGPDRDENAKPHSGDHYNTVCTVKLNKKGGGIFGKFFASRNFDKNFEPSFQLDIGQPSLEYLSSLGVKSMHALHYDPSNGTVSEGDIVRVKQ